MTENQSAQNRPPHSDLKRALVLSSVVLAQMILSVAVTLLQQPSAVGLAFLAGLPVFWGSIAGGIGGAGSLALNGALCLMSVFYSLRARRNLKRSTGSGRQARKVLAYSSLITAWWGAQVATTVMVIWVLNSVWG